MLRKLVIATTTPATLAAVAVKKSDTQPASATEQVDELAHYKCKPSDLPLYTPLHALNKVKRIEHRPSKESAAHEAIISGVRVVRQEVQNGVETVTSQWKTVDDYIDKAVAHSHITIDYLNQPNNILPRSGAIVIGGLAGFILGARGGFIKKVLYTTTGAGAVAAICYPREAEKFAQEALYESRKGYAIAYNFVKGVKPGDEVSVEPINKFPTSASELKALFWDLYDEAKEVVFPEKKK